MLGYTRHHSGCPISLRDVMLISLAAKTSLTPDALMSGERHAVSFSTFVLDPPEGTAAGRQQASRKTSYHAIKTQRPCLGERFTH